MAYWHTWHTLLRRKICYVSIVNMRTKEEQEFVVVLVLGQHVMFGAGCSVLSNRCKQTTLAVHPPCDKKKKVNDNPSRAAEHRQRKYPAVIGNTCTIIESYRDQPYKQQYEVDTKNGGLGREYRSHRAQAVTPTVDALRDSTYAWKTTGSRSNSPGRSGREREVLGEREKSSTGLKARVQEDLKAFSTATTVLYRQ